MKLIRSKGVGVYFCTQDPRDIPDSVMAQLNNKIEHGLRAYTPNDQKSVRAAADAFRPNPEFNTYDTILNLGVGQAVVSFLDEQGIPGMAQKVNILPPRSRMGSLSEEERRQAVISSVYYSKYAAASDPESAYEVLDRQAGEQDEAGEKTDAQKAEDKEARKAASARRRAAKSVGNSVAGTIGREVGKQVGGKFGSFGRVLGGNLGASLGRGILSTLFRG